MQGYAWHQEQPPPYPTIRHSQAQFNPQPYSTEHAPRHFSEQQELNRRSDPQAIPSGNADAFAFQQNPGRCDGQTNQTSPQQRFTGYQQHYMPSRVATHNTERQASDNPNSQIQYANFNHQSCLYVNSQQNYSMTGSSTTHVVPGQAQVHSTQRSDRESCITVTDNNRWHLGSNISNNGRSCQQPQARPADYYLQHPQQQSGHYSGQQQMLGQPLQSNPCIQNSPMNLRITNHEAQSRTAVMYTLHNSVTLPSAGPPSNNFQQSQTELRSNTSPDVPTAQSQDNQRSARRPTPDANDKTYNINQNHIHQQAPVQYNPTSRPPHFHMEAYVHSKLYEIVNSKQANFHSGSPTNTQPPDAGFQNRAAHKTKHYSNLKQLYADVLLSASEPPNKRMNYGVTRRKYWNKPSQNTKKSVSEDDTGQTRQSEIQYITDSAECLEAVFALQKVFQPVQKAVAIVPPISQTSNIEKVNNTSPKPVDSPPLMIDAVWSLAKESEPHNPSAKEIKDKLFEDSSPVVEQDDKICPESKTEPQNLSAKEIKYKLSQDFSPKLQQDDKVSPEKANNIADPCITESPNICSGNPKTDHQNDNQQSDCDSSDNAFDLSNVPVVTHTLEDLRSLVLSLETTESSAENTERPESVSDQILNLYWNGDTENLFKHVHELDKVRRYSYIDSVKNDTSVVFESITPENLKKVAYCEIVNKEICSLSKEFRSSWLIVDGQPADINKLLSEPLPDYITLSKCTSDVSINANEMQSVKPDCEYPADTFTPSTGNVMKRVVTENKVHSDAKIPGVTSLHNVPSEQETESEKQGDNTQNHKHLNTKLITDLSPLAHIQSTEQKDGTTTETLSQEHLKDKQEHDLIPAQKLSVPLTEKQVNEQPQNNFPCSNPINIVKNISDDERLDKMEVSTNSTDTIQVGNMSDDENSSNMEAISNTTDTRHMKDISDYDSSSNIKALTKSTDKVEDISSDENPSNESLLMDITVLSSEDALNFFQLLEKEPQCDIIAESNVVCPELVASSSEPNNEHNKVKNCSRCGTSIIVTPNSNDVTRTDNGGEVCPPCWNTAPSLNLETEVRNETNVLCSPTKSVQMCINDSPPSLKPIVHEKVVASTEEDNANEELKETTKEDSLVNSVPDSSCNETPEIQKNVEQECTKIQPDEAKEENIPSFFLLMQCNNPPPLKSIVKETITSKTIEIKNNVEQKLTKIQPAEAKNNSPEKLNISSSFLIMQCNNPPPPKPSVPDTSTSKTIEIKSNVEQELTKIQPDEAKDGNSENVNVSSFHLQMELNNPPTSKSSDITDSKKPKKTSEFEPQSNNPPPSKSAFFKRKLKSSNAEVASDECVLFTPDIVLKKNHPQKKNHSSGHLSLSVKHVTEPSQETQDPPLQAVTDRTLQDHKEKVTEKASSFSNKTFVTTALHRSNSMPEMEREKLTVKKLTIQKNNVKFALYGSKGEQQCATQGRRFSPPATLTVSSFKTYSDVVSAKQKVHNQWSSSFIPKVKKSPQKREKTKKKPLKPQEVLKSNMAALKEQLKHRTMLLSSQDIEQKRTQTLNG